MTELKTKILDTLKNNNLTMIPRWKFVLYTTLGILSAVFAFFVAIFMFSLVLFVLSRYGFLSLPFFDFIGTIHALSAIPVLLLIFTILLLILIEVISRKYTFTFRRPLGITLLAMTTFAVLVSFVISMTPIHEYIRDYAKTHRLDSISKAYDRPAPFKPRDGVVAVRGNIVGVSSSTITLQLFDGKELVVETASTTKSTVSTLKEGEDIVIFGTFANDSFTALEIREAPRGPFRKERSEDVRKEKGFPFLTPQNEINQRQMR